VAHHQRWICLVLRVQVLEVVPDVEAVDVEAVRRDDVGLAAEDASHSSAVSGETVVKTSARRARCLIWCCAVMPKRFACRRRRGREPLVEPRLASRWRPTDVAWVVNRGDGRLLHGEERGATPPAAWKCEEPRRGAGGVAGPARSERAGLEQRLTASPKPSTSCTSVAWERASTPSSRVSRRSSAVRVAPSMRASTMFQGE
jgi:hypothetical protein